MRHARSEALDRISPLLAKLRTRSDLREKGAGVFYVKSRAFLHFHEDGLKLFADVRLGDDFQRLPATTDAQQAKLLSRIDSRLARLKSSGPR